MELSHNCNMSFSFSLLSINSVQFSSVLFTADTGPLLASCFLASHYYDDDVQSYKHCDQHLRQLLQSELCPGPPMLSMPWMSSNRLLQIRIKLSIFSWAPASSWTGWTLSPCLLKSLPFCSPLLSGTLGSSWTKNCLLLST